MISKVKWFNQEKGYGFTCPENKKIFIHYSQVITDKIPMLKTGDIIQYNISNGKYGLYAKDIIVKNNKESEQ